MNADTNRPIMSAPTPETDASRGYALSSHYGRLEGSYLQMDRSGPFVHAEVARKLERERDEAWEEIKNLQGAYDDATNYYARIIELIDERDEAREKYTALATENMLAVNKLAEERDEARAVAAELASAASHCLGWHDCRLNISEKIAAALKRWKKIKGEL